MLIESETAHGYVLGAERVGSVEDDVAAALVGEALDRFR